ncbi:Phycobilisome linker polypeptide [[Leptolyngbya] sp. PCC 7376]|uniref:phycobilisome rod-core linker polypeptide n=1 Tax=[Leptolyngbya] sp. PCC 7376 TaxID=111781 RepID=UPI00029EEEC3|nr:phycobilisome rod-core linker polypeptide [[Leptolyngbya] sp. PCC 7376]AFY38162.1 Phycobilisome linker polypeptide [[Leptolyngbya] sp. PCC 7376]
MQSSSKAIPSAPKPAAAISAVANKAFSTVDPVEYISRANISEAIGQRDVEQQDVVIAAAYKQVFGNAHLMESERDTYAESQLRNGSITVMEFVRRLAKSERYRALVLEQHSNVRAIELNFKHLLGRAPENKEEVSEHIVRLANEGFEAEIDSYINSDEYWKCFGTDIVPHYRGYNTQTGQNLAGYTRSFQLVRSMSSSDKSTPAESYGRLENSLFKGDFETAAALLNGVGVAETVEPKPKQSTYPADAPITRYGSVTSFPSSSIYSTREIIRRAVNQIL